MTPDEYAQQKTAQSGSSFYYSFLFLPPPRRRAITALYAFCREVDDVVDEVSDPAVARIKLAWWRREVGAVFDGTPQHPVALALKEVVGVYGLPRADFDAIIDGMAMDLDQNRYQDFVSLERYCHRVAGVDPGRRQRQVPSHVLPPFPEGTPSGAPPTRLQVSPSTLMSALA